MHGLPNDASLAVVASVFQEVTMSRQRRGRCPGSGWVSRPLALVAGSTFGSARRLDRRHESPKVVMTQRAASTYGPDREEPDVAL